MLFVALVDLQRCCKLPQPHQPSPVLTGSSRLYREQSSCNTSALTASKSTNSCFSYRVCEFAPHLQFCGICEDRFAVSSPQRKPVRMNSPPTVAYKTTPRLGHLFCQVWGVSVNFNKGVFGLSGGGGHETSQMPVTFVFHVKHVHLGKTSPRHIIAPSLLNRLISTLAFEF